MGDYVRWAPPFYGDDSAQPLGTRSALYLALNRDKRSVRLDLKSEAGRDAFLALVRHADVVLESFRPGVLDRLGVGYDRLREENPRIVYCAITGYGLDGPNTARAGHDTNYLALNGLLGLTGAADGPPVSSAGQIADLGGGGLMAASAILAALHERERSGEGQVVDVSMTDGALSWLAMVAGRVPVRRRGPAARGRAADGAFVCYLPYEARTAGSRCGALEPQFWRRSAPASGVRICSSSNSRDRARRDMARRSPRSSAAGRGPSGGRSTTSTTLHRTGPRPRRGARLGARPGARDGGRGGAARDRDRPPARRPVKLSRTPGTRPVRLRRSASTRRRCSRGRDRRRRDREAPRRPVPRPARPQRPSEARFLS